VSNASLQKYTQFYVIIAVGWVTTSLVGGLVSSYQY